jgi:hypothetical protein
MVGLTRGKASIWIIEDAPLVLRSLWKGVCLGAQYPDFGKFFFLPYELERMGCEDRIIALRLYNMA